MGNHGTDPRTRMRLMRERVEAMKAIWTQDEASYHGEFVYFDRIWSWPKPAQRPHPPVLVGGNGPTVLDRVLAFGDAWFPNWPATACSSASAELRARADRPIDVMVMGLPADPACSSAASRPAAGASCTGSRRGTGRWSSAGSSAGRRRSPSSPARGEASAAEARERFAAARVARLATADADGRPHLVPIVFAVDGDRVYSVVDDKPKRTTALRRLRNVAANPRVALLADHYDDGLGRAVVGARRGGRARTRSGLGRRRAEAARAVDLLRATLPQQRAVGAVLAVDVERWSGWAAAAA